jgi:hypothetical protein
MRTKSRTRGRGLVLAVLTLIVSLPELAQAQQSGLFPLAPIKRQRVPCDQQDPVYKLYKEKYFGYHPPCWRPFPTGWGCPSPEKPDVAKSFREQKLGTLEGAEQGDTGEPAQGDQGQGRPAVPALPGGRSPFEQPGPGGGRPGGNPAAPRQDQKPVSPFDLEDSPATKPDAAPGAPRGAGRAQPATPAIGEGTPDLSSPDESGRVQGARTSQILREEQVQPRNEDGPLLALPEVTLAPVAVSDASFGTQPAQTSTMTDDTAGAQAPANSAPRRGFLSGLFNNLGWNWTRR